MCGGAASQLASNGRQVSRRSWSAGSFHDRSGHQHPHVSLRPGGICRHQRRWTNSSGATTVDAAKAFVERAFGIGDLPGESDASGNARGRATIRHAYGIHVRDEGGHLQRIGAAPRPGEGGQGP